jgi:hypothetical protein
MAVYNPYTKIDSANTDLYRTQYHLIPDEYQPNTGLIPSNTTPNTV